MEIFLIKNCEIIGSTATIPAGTNINCSYGGVLAYIPVLLFLIFVFGLSYYFIKYIIKKTI